MTVAPKGLEMCVTTLCGSSANGEFKKSKVSVLFFLFFLFLQEAAVSLVDR